MKSLLVLLAFFTITLVHGQDFDYSTRTATSEKGYLGIINGQKLFYEIWNERATNDLDYSIILLRTDTIDMTDSVDFSVSDLFNYIGSDSIHVSINKHDSITGNDSTIHFSTIDAKNIPTVFQILKIEHGCQIFWNFNKPNSESKFQLKNNELILTYCYHCRYDNSQIVTDIYKIANGQFKLVKTKSKIIKE